MATSYTDLVQASLDKWNHDDSTRYSQLLHSAEQQGLVTLEPEIRCVNPREMISFLDRNILPDDLDCIGATPEKTISNIRNKYRCELSHA